MTDPDVARLRALCEQAKVPDGMAPFISVDDVLGLLDRIAALEKRIAGYELLRKWQRREGEGG